MDAPASVVLLQLAVAQATPRTLALAPGPRPRPPIARSPVVVVVVVHGARLLGRPNLDQRSHQPGLCPSVSPPRASRASASASLVVVGRSHARQPRPLPLPLSRPRPSARSHPGLPQGPVAVTRSGVPQLPPGGAHRTGVARSPSPTSGLVVFLVLVLSPDQAPVVSGPSHPQQQQQQPLLDSPPDPLGRPRGSTAPTAASSPARLVGPRSHPLPLAPQSKHARTPTAAGPAG